MPTAFPDRLPRKAARPSPSRAAPLHRYHHVHLVLRQRLLEGHYGEGGMLPSERALAEEFDVARVTLRSAMAALERDGLVARRQGRGTVSLPRAGARGVDAAVPTRDAFEQLFASVMDMGLKTKARVLSYGLVEASPDICDALQLDPRSQVMRIVRVRSQAGQPVSYATAFIPRPLALQIHRRDLATQPLLALLAKQGVRIDSADEVISATQADIDAAQALQVPVASALLKVRRLILDVDRKPVELFEGLFRPEGYRYHLTTARDPSRTRVRVAIGNI
ncbi:GntR family transcriptional regulator [Variovorax sp. PAMC 28711]|uniref:GntR family transcriptional regulator n=1 Tax=Variovorax sp. PAMC 28711 TaxID=1795631 RepID=UPI00078ED1DA|nr:GntR family transcriptional regulator [Variovorax sp. PAMC 28711]AMM23228.1 hypothetical protein AX767_01680 [Variovorax sp. PAMC 28711]